MLVVAALNSDDSPSPAAAQTTSDSPTPTPTPSPTPSKKADDRVRVRESAYLGRDAKEVKGELEDLGFKVHEEKVTPSSPDQREHTVGAVRPNGLVEPGTTITIEVWDKYEAQDLLNHGGGLMPGKEPKGKSKGKNH